MKYFIIGAEENKVYLAECLIKKHDCRDNLYYGICASNVLRHKQSRSSDTGWTPETLLDTTVQISPGQAELKKKERKEFWGLINRK